ncbi:bis(5'-nucleosyl)-tetraphosphatase (symmetrical) YqeK [Clostridium kluyveri]|uniref:bis(5'-nucleosyl)-tetraphosphatase (symmetrical) n=1 Tax=Clostridium kluyveri TaxID=1534 RepID=A0A1L5F5H2_CLOKL|nr:bis(5'-nucleosyl)-tetraphosphatase (symmetrical) YqeK [Clostridium kluyveri]APM38265.1 phosphohydrolase [Clostridium kluyveri]UZQ51724.1 bis(5'-nucleosyl)-tetraphosphatase (symmetrical) YqeK [Clostridium kluyveri]
MWSEEEIKEYLKERLSEKRYKHSLNVKITAIKLAEAYNGDVNKAALAGLIHDCAKYMSGNEILNLAVKNGILIDEVSRLNPNLLHGSVAVVVAKKIMGIFDEDILSAIACHTTGKKNMNLLEKIIYIADYIEPARNFPGVEELREKAFVDLDGAILDAFNNTIKVVINRGQLLHLNTIEGRNYLVFHSGEK